MSASPSSSVRLVATRPTAFTALQAVRGQAAFLRSLLDEVERLTPGAVGSDGIADQVVEEIARLGCRSLEAAAELTQLVADARRSA